MQDNGKKIIAEYVRTHKLKKRWHQVTAVLAALAVIITAAVMVMPAVTMGNSPEWQCALDLHEHTSECYDSEATSSAATRTSSYIRIITCATTRTAI